MRLSDWAKRQGITHKTAWNWFRDGRLPVREEQMPTGTIIVYCRRKKLIRLLENPDERMILVEQEDRLARFGVEYIETALVSQGRSIIVADDTEEMSDIAPASTESVGRS
jgi:putative resolvase